MRLFVYGTLMVPELVQRLLGSERPGQPMTVQGFRKVETDRLPYPFAVQDEAGHIDGVLLDEITDEDMTRLDKYEGVIHHLFLRVPLPGLDDAWLYLGGPVLRRRYLR